MADCVDVIGQKVDRMDVKTKHREQIAL